MRKDQKSYRNRKPYKRKSGGAKFMLGGRQRKDVSFDMSSMDRGMRAGISNFISLILGRKQRGRVQEG